MSAYVAKPSDFETSRNVRVLAPGVMNAIGRDTWRLHRMDDGAFRVQYHTTESGLLFILGLNDILAPSIDEYVIEVDNQDAGGRTAVLLRGRILYQRFDVRLTKHHPAWMWVRYTHGRIEAGFGGDPNNSTTRFLNFNARVQGARGSRYSTIRIGRTGDAGNTRRHSAYDAVELLNVDMLQPVNDGYRGVYAGLSSFARRFSAGLWRGSPYSH